MDCCKVFWAIFFPPIAVCLHRGCCTCAVLINICLTLLGWIPGQVHAFCVITDTDVKTDKPYDEEEARPAAAPQQPVAATPAAAPEAAAPAAAPVAEAAQETAVAEAK